jgi:DNA-binding NtrC family response regulator
MLAAKINQYSPKLQEVLDLARTAARYPDTNVLITGENGTGKERIARLIHNSSSRADYLFKVVDCRAIAVSVFEQEFFGYKKGAVAGSRRDKAGFFELCDRGSLFLENIAYLPLNLQTKITRAIEEQLITRVGDTKPVQTNFRIISSTESDLDRMVDKHLFRLELLHRLNTLHIHVPALRERKEDIPLLLDEFIQGFSEKFGKPAPLITETTIDKLTAYPFFGNVRELKNMTERALIQCKENILEIEHFLY